MDEENILSYSIFIFNIPKILDLNIDDFVHFIILSTC